MRCSRRLYLCCRENGYLYLRSVWNAGEIDRGVKASLRTKRRDIRKGKKVGTGCTRVKVKLTFGQFI